MYMISDVAGICVDFFFSSRRRHTIFKCDWSSDVCSSDLVFIKFRQARINHAHRDGRIVIWSLCRIKDADILGTNIWEDQYLVRCQGGCSTCARSCRTPSATRRQDNQQSTEKQESSRQTPCAYGFRLGSARRRYRSKRNPLCRSTRPATSPRSPGL